MLKKTGFVLSMVMAMALSSARADGGGSGNTIVYPSDNPVFSVTFPDGWDTESEENLLHAYPADQSIYLGIWALEKDVKLEDALDALDETISSMVTDLKVGEADKNVINGMDFLSVDGSGKDEDGDDVNVSAAVFSPDDKQVFILIYYATPKAEKLHEKEMTDILLSINGEK